MQGTWCTVEVMKALEKGYQILQIHEVWHFPRKTEALFKEYMDTLPYNTLPYKTLPYGYYYILLYVKTIC